MTADEFYETLQRECAFYGFLECPLTREESDTLYDQGVSLAEAYGIACDVAAGFPFNPPEGR